MATYNGERYLPRQLETIASQSVLPDELVVTDDGSTDKTLDIIEAFAAKVPFAVRINRNQDRLGFQRNFRRATQLCISDLIFFCDQDDVWLPTKIAKVRDAFTSSETLLVYHSATVVSEDEKPLYRMYSSREHDAILAQKPMHPWPSIFGLVQAIRGDLRVHDHLWDRGVNHIWHADIMAHDQWYLFLALALGNVAYLDQELVLYRQHGRNAIGASGQPTRWQRLAMRLNHHAETDQLGALAAERRAEILRSIASSASGTGETRLLEIADAYEAFSRRLGRRAGTYMRHALPGRLSSLTRSLIKGDYRGNPWGFDQRSIARDIISGVLCGGAHTVASRP